MLELGAIGTAAALFSRMFVRVALAGLMRVIAWQMVRGRRREAS
jgi:hypothetical protein